MQGEFLIVSPPCLFYFLKFFLNMVAHSRATASKSLKYFAYFKNLRFLRLHSQVHSPWIGNVVANFAFSNYILILPKLLARQLASQPPSQLTSFAGEAGQEGGLKVQAQAEPAYCPRPYGLGLGCKRNI